MLSSAGPSSQSISAEQKDKVKDATNQFFEARVAVMGFKCRVMQLQGQLEETKKKLHSPGSVSLVLTNPLQLV